MYNLMPVGYNPVRKKRNIRKLKPKQKISVIGSYKYDGFFLRNTLEIHFVTKETIVSMYS